MKMLGPPDISVLDWSARQAYGGATWHAATSPTHHPPRAPPLRVAKARPFSSFETLNCSRERTHLLKITYLHHHWPSIRIPHRACAASNASSPSPHDPLFK